MALKFYHGFFKDRSDVLDDVKQNNTWPTTYVSGPSEGLHAHWHSQEVHAYIVEGETDFYDKETDIRTKVEAGDKIVVPARTLHAEGAVNDKVVYILALPEALLPDDFLVLRDPEDL